MRHWISWLPVGAVAPLVVGFALGCPRDARACECVEQPLEMRPGPADAEVPSNTKIWLTGSSYALSECESAAIEDSTGQSIGFTPSFLAEPANRYRKLMVLTPADPLTVGETYRLTGCESHAFDAPELRFTVNADADTSAPAVPSVTAQEPVRDGSSNSSCGEAEYVPMDIDHGGAIALLDIAAESNLAPVSPSGTVTDVFFGTDYVVGSQICGRHNWDFEEEGDATDVRFAVFDLAGNFSGWSDPQDVETGCACRVEPGRSGSEGRASALVLALLALGAGAVRRHRTSSRTALAR
jgi:hypothetical protein